MLLIAISFCVNGMSRVTDESGLLINTLYSRAPTPFSGTTSARRVMVFRLTSKIHHFKGSLHFPVEGDLQTVVTDSQNITETGAAATCLTHPHRVRPHMRSLI